MLRIAAFQTYTRYLSNQGNLVMNPEKHTFAGSINFSSNIDFFEIVNNKIELIKSLRLGDPINKPVNEEGIYYVDLTENTQTGYIDLSATSKYVYALYSDKKMYENNRKSDTVLVFDWDGNPIKKYSLDTDAYYIAVDSTQQSLFAAVKNSSSGWKIICYAARLMIHTIYGFSLPADIFPFVFTDSEKVLLLSFYVW